MTRNRHAPTAVAAVLSKIEPTTVDVQVSWQLDTAQWPDSDVPEHWVVEVEGAASQQLEPEDRSCAVKGVPRPALAWTANVRVCGWWSGDPAAETQCSTTTVDLPALPSRPTPPPVTPPPPTLKPLEPLPRTLREPARLAADWIGSATQYQYTYESGRDDLVDELTHDTSLVFPAAPLVTYRFSVRGRIPDNTRGAEEQWSAWSRAEGAVGAPTSLRTFLGGESGAGGVAALARSHGLDPTSLRELMHA